MKWLGENSQKKTIFFDINFRKNLWLNLDEARETLKIAMKTASVCLPSIEDLNDIFGMGLSLEFLTRYCKNPEEFFVIKNGGNQAPEIMLSDGKLIKLERFNKLNKVLDATGAGDSFNAGFIGGYLMGKSLSNSLQLGSNLALKTLKKIGAICSIEETEEFNLTKHLQNNLN